VSAGTLVVGSGQAALQLAVSLREFGDTEPITLVGAEAHSPYQRPPLSKAFLHGTTEAASLALRTPDFYTQQRITLVSGERVTRLEDGIAATDGGRTLRYQRLALAVGVRPRRLPVPGTDLSGVHYLRDLGDAERLRERLTAGRRVVVVGGGFIGLEVAAAATAHGCAVTVVEAADRLLARAVAPAISEFYRHAHLSRGVDVRTGVSVVAIHGHPSSGQDNSARNKAPNSVREIELGDGSRLPADVVLIGIGAEPRLELARQLGLRCQGGIEVDRFARTSRPEIVAAGDCTLCPEPLSGQGLVRIESVQNAQAQARAAAASLAGRLEPHAGVPWFWSDQGDLKLQIAGLSHPGDLHVVRGSMAEERFSVLHYRAGRLVAADSVNQAADHLAVRAALARGVDLPAELAADAARPLKHLLLDRRSA